MKLSTLSVLFK